ncbi:MAG: PilZ domain-containing protein [Gammaproteobacteria bacterium]|nr:PilZ domain-containing protein [Gammaproteobacteria bacterium]
MTDSGAAQAGNASRRAHYRIDYAPGDRPHLRCGERRYEVLNLSEGGVLIQVSQTEELHPGETLAVTIEFTDATEIDVEGCVLRRDADADAVVLQLSSRVPLSVIVEQQRQLIAKYRQVDTD